MKKTLVSFLLAGIVAWMGTANAQTQTIAVGNGTDSATTAAMNTVYKGSITHTLYLGSELNPNGTISVANPVNIYSVSFFHCPTSSAGNWNHHIRVYLTNVSRNSFSNSTDFEALADSCWRGGTNLDLGSAPRGWVDINLSMPYTYTGGNLMVTIIVDSAATGNGHYFRCHNTNDNKRLSYYPGDGSHCPTINDIGNYSCTSVSTQRADIKFTYMPVTPATLPYTTNFSDNADNLKWCSKYLTPDQAVWWIPWSYGTPEKLYCGANIAYLYNTDFEESVLCWRTLQLDNSDSIKVQFNLLVGGEGVPDDYDDECYDFLSVFFMPNSFTDMHQACAQKDLPDGLLGNSIEYGFVDGNYEWLRFGNDSVIENYKLNHRNELVTATFRNRWTGQKGHLVFVWRNDNSDGNGDAVKIENLSVTGVGGTSALHNATATDLSVYPNPTKDVLNISGVEKDTELRIYDISGKVVLQQTASGNTAINVENLDKGVYVIAAGTNKVKFVKQ